MNDELAKLTPAGCWKVWVIYEDTFACIAIMANNATAHSLAKLLRSNFENWQMVVTRALVTDMKVDEDPEVDTSTFANHNGKFADND